MKLLKASIGLNAECEADSNAGTRIRSECGKKTVGECFGMRDCKSMEKGFD